MDGIVLVLLADGLHGRAEFATIVVLDCHLDVGEDREGNLCLGYYDAECGHLGGFCPEDFYVGAALFL